MEIIDVSNCLGNGRSFLIGPWNWVTLEDNFVSFYIDKNIIVKSNFEVVEKLLNANSYIELEIDNDMREKLVIYGCLKNRINKYDHLSSLISRLENYFCKEFNMELQCELIIDTLPSEFNFDGMSLPGVILLSQKTIDQQNIVTIVHELAHQWWGPQLLQGVREAPVWTESLVEALSIIYAVTQKKEQGIKALKTSYYLHHKLSRFRLKMKEIIIEDYPYDKNSYCFVYGSIVLFYILAYLSMNKDRWKDVIRLLAVEKVKSLDHWVNFFGEFIDRENFLNQPVDEINSLMHKEKKGFIEFINI